MTSLDLLRTFLAVHRAGSVTAAAQLLGLSQPAVTAQLKALEKHLGKPLFNRHARGVTTTAAGEDLARRLAGPLDDLTAAVGDFVGGKVALHVGGPAELMSLKAVPSLVELRDTALRVTFGTAEELLDELAKGGLDLVISTVRPRVRGIVSAPLFVEELTVVAAPRWYYPDTTGVLGEAPWVSCTEDLSLIRRFWQAVYRTTPPGNAVVVVPDLRAVLAATLAGAGATVLPRYLCEDELATGALRELVIRGELPTDTLYLAVRTGAFGEPHIARARDLLMAHAAEW
ncbi:LysR family transcriptional regulator [Actinophytocola oryzae]|uniref:DNA-binding transcriptional LysR family regulator n=1 Tax=Actinophytocola oryzae TaxID=502181 RepID=A0A4R7UZL7_9PSEU|nr:LysR family transcriptional regulator [Actinophytocola oryzae]TDV41704.1 DNA-binding transcriptional LysR family regulator [Actinophytocola oryzae]